MGHIKEPKGIDFIIQSEPLTELEKRSISKFIADYKIKSKVLLNKSKKLEFA